MKFLNIHRKIPVFGSLFNQAAGLQACNFVKKSFQHRCFSVNIAKFLKMLILKKICKRLLLNNVKLNYSSMKTVKQMVNVSQHSQGNTFTRVTFIVTAGNLKLISLFKKRFRHCSLSDSYLKFLTATFLMGIVTRKSIVIRKRGSSLVYNTSARHK